MASISLSHTLTPRRTIWRFFFAVIAVIGISLLCCSLAILFTGRKLLLEIQRESALNAISSVESTLRQNGEELAAFRMRRLNELRGEVSSDITSVTRILETYNREADRGVYGPEQAQVAALNRLAGLPAAFGRRIVILNGPGEPIFQDEGTAMVPGAASALGLSEGMRRLADTASSRPGVVQYEYISLGLDGQNTIRPELAGAARFAPWGWTVFATAQLSALLLETSQVNESLHKRLSQRIEEIAETGGGMVMVFSEDCQVAAAPAAFFPASPDPGILRRWVPLCGTLQDGALSLGRESLSFKWNRDDDVSPESRIGWVHRHGPNGPFVAASIPQSLIDENLLRFGRILLVPGILALAALGLAMFLLLRSLLRPVEHLAGVCLRVASGDLTARADESLPGEIGELCRQFNAMSRNLQELLQTEQFRQIELDELNKDLERKIEARTRDLADKARELEAANLRLTEMDTLKSAFLSSVSHELRTPLTSVLGFAKLINKDFRRHFGPLVDQDGQLPPKAERIERNLDIIIHEGERLTRLINDVLDLAKIESGRMVWRDEPLAVEELVSTAVAAVSGRLEDRPGLRLKAHVEPGLPSLCVDRDRMLQVLINLLDNAIKFTPEGEVSITAAAQAVHGGPGLRFEIADTGRGIQAQDLEKIFDKFHQVLASDTLLGKPAGTGLGLAICRQIVERYGGRIWAQSQPGRGSRLLIVLPAMPVVREMGPDSLAADKTRGGALA